MSFECSSCPVYPTAIIWGDWQAGQMDHSKLQLPIYPKKGTSAGRAAVSMTDQHVKATFSYSLPLGRWAGPAARTIFKHNQMCKSSLKLPFMFICHWSAMLTQHPCLSFFGQTGCWAVKAAGSMKYECVRVALWILWLLGTTQLIGNRDKIPKLEWFLINKSVLWILFWFIESTKWIDSSFKEFACSYSIGSQN